MSSISQHISHDFFELGRTSIIYGVTDIIFSLKQHISPSGKLFAEVSLFLYRSYGQSETCCIIVLTRRKVYRSLCEEVLAPLSDSFPFTVR